MVAVNKFRAVCAVMLAGALTASPAYALVSFNDGSDHLFFTGTASMAYDSNIFAHAGGAGDTIYSAGLLFEYTRRAGMIGVDASVALNASRFGDNTSENFNNPRFAAEFTKIAGRTTGALTVTAERLSEADVLANVRTDSWNYDAALHFKYPVIERYSFSGTLAYTDKVYNGAANLTDLQTFTVGTDLLYALRSDRDLTAGYQFRHSDTSSSASYADHSFTVGVSGKILPKLTGSVRAGYEVRLPLGSTPNGGYKGLTASGSVTWTLTKKWSLVGQLSRDVSVTANDLSVDTSSTSLALRYVMNDRLSFSTNAGVGQTRFLGDAGAGRHDEYFTWGAGLKYKMNEHLDSALAYVYNQNWSTFSFSDFSRHSVTLTLSSRW